MNTRMNGIFYRILTVAFLAMTVSMGAFAQATATPSELADQTKRHMGFQEVLDKNTRLKGGWQRSTLGFVGDAALDPTNLVLGGSNTAMRSAKPISREIEAAVRTGGASGIAKEIAVAAANEGLSESVAVKKLIVDAGQRGRGALTEKGLARAGVSEAEKEALGLGTITK